jgi:hypothetical protein
VLVPETHRDGRRDMRSKWWFTALLALPVVATLSGCNRVTPTMTFETRKYLPVVAAAFSPDGSHIVVGSAAESGSDGAVCVADVRTGKRIAITQLADVPSPHRVRCLAICPDNSGIWVGTGAVLDLDSRDRRRIGEGIADVGDLILLDFKTLKVRKRLNVHDTVNGLALLRDGKTLVVLTCSHQSAEKVDLTLWNAESGTCGKPITLDGHTYPDHFLLHQRMLAMSPDGKLLAIALGRLMFYPAEVVIWDVQKNEKVTTIGVRSGPPTWVGFSSDGMELAISTWNCLSIADVTSGQIKFPSWEMHAAAVDAIPGHSRRFIGGPSGMQIVHLLDPSKQTYGLRFEGGPSSYNCLRSLAVSSDGKHLAAGDDHGRVYIWRIPRP